MHDLLFDKCDDSSVRELAKYYTPVIHFVFVCGKTTRTYHTDLEWGLRTTLTKKSLNITAEFSEKLQQVLNKGSQVSLAETRVEQI